MRSATGVREVPQGRGQVWQALAVLEPYCAVCDVSYVVRGSGAGTTFVCLPGRPEAADPGPEALRGEIVEWQPRRLVAPRLHRPAETWTTRIELADAADGGTRVTVTLTHEPTTGGRVLRRVQRGAMRRLVQRTVDAELDKVPAHLARVTG